MVLTLQDARMFRFRNAVRGLSRVLRYVSSDEKPGNLKEVLSQLRQTTPIPSLADLDHLGGCLVHQVDALSSNDVLEMTRCFVQWKYIRPEWIQLLSKQFVQNTNSVQTNVKFLASLATLQRLHDKQLSNKNSLFTDDHLPSFVSIQHSPMLINQKDLVEGMINMIPMESQLEDRDVVSVIYALSQLVPGVQKFNELTKDILRSQLPIRSFDLTASTILLYSLSRLQIRDQTLLTPIVQSLIQDSTKIQDFPLENFSMLFYSLGKLKWSNQRLMKQLLNQANRRSVLGRFSTWDLSSLCYSLSSLESENVSDAYLVLLAKEVSRTQRLSTFSEQGLSLVVYSLSKLRCGHPKVFETLLEEVLKPFRVAELTYQGLCMMVHGLGKLPRTQKDSLQEQYQTLTQLLTDTVKIKQTEVRRYSPHELVSFLFGVMLVRSELDRSECTQILDSINEQTSGFGDDFLNQLSAKEILILIKALSRLGWNSTNHWNLIVNHLISKREEGDIKNTGILTSALYITSSKKHTKSIDSSNDSNTAILKIINESEFEDLSATDLVQLIQSISADSGSIFEDSNFLQKVLTEINKETRLTVFTNHHFVNLLASLIQIKITPEILSLPLRILKSRIQSTQVDDFGLVTLLYYFSKHRTSDDPFLTLLKNEYVNRKGIEDRLGTEYISMTVQSFANIGISDFGLLTPLLQELMSIQKLRTFSDKSLILILHSLMKLNLKSTRLLVLSGQVLLQRGSVDSMELDLLSTFVYTLGRFQYYNQELFDVLIQRLLRDGVQEMELIGCVNVLDALGRLGLDHEEILLDQLLEEIFKQDKESPLLARTASSVLHSIGRLKLKDQKTKEYLERMTRKHRVEALDAYGISGLIFALIEAQMTDGENGTPIVEVLELRGDLGKLRVGHLGNLICRFHAFDRQEHYISFILSLMTQIDAKLKSKELTVGNLGQFIMGIGRLAQMYGLESDPVVLSTFESMMKSEILTQMSVSDLIGNISASSHCPKVCLRLAVQTSKYLMETESLPKCSNKELQILSRTLPSFGQIPEIQELVIEVRREWNERRRKALIVNENLF